mgnify:FL=1
MEKSKVVERVSAYLETSILRGESCSLEKTGLWEVTGWGSGRSKIGPIYHGSFLEVVATAVEDGSFFRELLTQPYKYLFGEIKEIEIKELGRNFNPADLEEKVVG